MAEKEYRFKIVNRQNDVEISDGPDSVALRLTRGKSVIVVLDAKSQPLLEIQRVRSFPYQRFRVTQDNNEIGTIDTLNLLRTRYSISFSNGESWLFHMPIFTAYFRAISNVGAVKVQMLRENLWKLLFETGQDSTKLLATLAIIFRSRWTGVIRS